ncbi:MAG: molybdenum cofactor guanylyltransferase [Dehalococcoidia bacterium]
MEEPAAGIVLAGGRSQRMGRDKARLALPDGRPLILSVVELLKDVCDEVVVVTDVPGRYADLDLPVRQVTDVVPGQGPLGGLQAGLQAVEAPFALTVACDMPFLNPSLLRYMVGLSRDYEALVPMVEGRWQPLHAIYANACLPAVDDLLDQGVLALTDLLSRVQVRALPFAAVRRFDPQGLSFRNLNEPEDLTQMSAAGAMRDMSSRSRAATRSKR